MWHEMIHNIKTFRIEFDVKDPHGDELMQERYNSSD